MLTYFSPAWPICYAPIDLKNATIYFRDGFGNTTAGGKNETPEVEGDPGSAGVTTTNIRAMNVPVPVGARFTIAPSTTEHTVSARVVSSAANASMVNQLALGGASGGTYQLAFRGQTTANLAFNANAAAIESALEALSTIGSGNVAVAAGTDFDITFQGALANLDLPLVEVADDSTTGGSGVVITETTRGNKQNFSTSALTFAPGLENDLSGSEPIVFLPIQLEVNIGEGNIQFSETRELEIFRNRGKLDTVREGDEQPVEATLEFLWDFIRSLPGSSTPTVEEALKRIGPAATWTSAAEDACEPFALDLVIDNLPDQQCVNTLGREIITLEDFRHTELDHNADEGQISVTGQSNRTTAIVERTTS